jgi:hypothetical protein
LSNVKNFLKSVGSRIVAIHDLSQKLERGQPILVRARPPTATPIVVVKRPDAEKVSIQTLLQVFHGALPSSHFRIAVPQDAPSILR